MTGTRHRRAYRSWVRVVPFFAAGVLVLVAVIACQRHSGPEPPPDASVELTPPRPVLPPEWNDILDVTWAGDNAIVFITLAGGVYRKDLTTDREPTRLGTVDFALQTAADPNGQVVAVSGAFGELVAWKADGTVLVRDNSALTTVALAIDDAGTRLVLGTFSVDVFQLEPYRLVSSGQQPDQEDLSGYDSLIFEGNRVVGTPTGDDLDVWDVSETAAALTRQDCQCDRTREVVDPAARQAVFATSAGHLILWDIDQARAVADRTLITSPGQYIEPFAVVAGRIVLFSLDHPTVPGGQLRRGPLQAWDTTTNTVVKVWDCPGCEVRRIMRRPPGNDLLIYTETSDRRYAPALWTAVLRR